MIDQLLDEQEQNSIKKKAPPQPAKRPPGRGFGGLKAPPRTDMIDKLLMGEGEDEDEIVSNGVKGSIDSESLRDDGRPAKLP